MASHIGPRRTRTSPWTSRVWRIRKYADDQALFFRDFAAAYAKMSEIGATFA